MIEVNSNQSYLGKDIRKWCENCPEIKSKYYESNERYQPNDKVYYFVNYINEKDSSGENNHSSKLGFRLDRDLDKSPRRQKPTTEYVFYSSFIDTIDLILEIEAESKNEWFKMIINTWDDRYSVYYLEGSCPRNKGVFETQLFKYLRDKYPEHF